MSASQRVSLASLLLLLGTLPAVAFSDAELVDRYCGGGIQSYTMPDRTEADCITDTHALEVEKSDYWYSALGQALNYAYGTREIAADPGGYQRVGRQIDGPKKAGIVLVCEKPRETCTDHYARLFRIIEDFRLPVTIWDCMPEKDATLDTCLKIDMPPETRMASNYWQLVGLFALTALLFTLIWLNGRMRREMPSPSPLSPPIEPPRSHQC